VIGLQGCPSIGNLCALSTHCQYNNPANGSQLKEVYLHTKEYNPPLLKHACTSGYMKQSRKIGFTQR
jgi:hypothetical protein